ncbi:8924_t:CDS:2, partial [Acaulospora morrowiae]
MQNQQSSPYLNISGLNLGGESVEGYDPSEVPLPLPSKNPLRTERIISTLIRESEALTSNTQFNIPSTNRKDAPSAKPSDLQRSSTV